MIEWVNKMLKAIDNQFESIDNNKNLLIVILIFLGVYFAYFNKNIVESGINLFDNEIFKLIVFILITYISSSSPAIGVSLAIIMLVSLQIITHLKLKKEIDNDVDVILSEYELQ